MRNNFRKTINKDPDFIMAQKEIQAMNKDMEKLRKKSDLRVSKIISDMIPEAISHHKWKISTEEAYVPGGSVFHDCFTLSFCIADEDKYPKTPMAVAAISSNKPKPYTNKSYSTKFTKKMSIRLNKKSYDSKNFWGIFRICDEFESYIFKYKKVSIGVGSGGNIVICSKKSIDDVYAAAKSLGIKLDMKSHLEYIESLEEQIRKTKSLVSDLSANMLFNL
jgi:hypothetical protein